MAEYQQPDYSLLGDEHVARYRETDGEVGYIWNGATTLLLTTTGRKSGEPRTAPLIFAPDGDHCIVVASMGGAPMHPQWYRNLEVNPDVEVQIKGERFTARARTVEGEERERGWASRPSSGPTTTSTPSARRASFPSSCWSACDNREATAGPGRELGRLLGRRGARRARAPAVLRVPALHDASDDRVPGLRHDRPAIHV